MSSGALVGGVAGLNAIFLVAGYGALACGLRRATPRVVLSYAGVALLAGAGLVGAVLCVVAVAGATTGPLALALVAAGVAAVGLVAARRLRARDPDPSPILREDGWWDAAATAACAALVALAGFAVVGGFRSSPWLDDSWSFWLPKGIVLGQSGLDLRLWGSNLHYPTWISPDYPLWWSNVTALDLRFVGAVDLRALNGQLAVFLVAFGAAVARLLWGIVRPSLLWPGLLLLGAMPELLRQAQGGGADLPVAMYVVLLAVAGSVWLVRGDTIALISAFAFAAAALAIKNEGMPEAFLVVLVLTVAGRRAGLRRVASLWAALAGGVALAAPWFVWRQVHRIHADVSFSRSFDVGYLLDRTSRIGPTLHTLLSNVFDPAQWLLALPLALALSLGCLLWTRRLVWVVPAVLLVLLFALLVWVYWADTLDLTYRLATSGYRTIDTVTLLAAVSIPVLAEVLVRAGTGRSWGLRTRAGAPASASTGAG